MATAVHLSLAEYLSTDYEPDCEYLDGAVEERNEGKRKHSKTQALLSAKLQALEGKHGCDVLIEQRVQLSSSRVRIPDICLVSREESDEVIRRPPILWVEILSPEDRWSRIQVKIDDCLSFGVETLWIIDPYSRQAWIAKQGTGVKEVLDGKLKCDHPDVEIVLAEILPEA